MKSKLVLEIKILVLAKVVFRAYFTGLFGIAKKKI